MHKRETHFLELEFPYEVEQLKISQNSILTRINVASGKDGNFWVCVSPSLHVSGYGKTLKEAQISFKENMETFYGDLLSLNSKERKKVLASLGWEQKKFFNKQYSKAFVDEDGILQDLEQPQLVSLETIA